MPMCLDEEQFMNMGFNTLSHTKRVANKNNGRKIYMRKKQRLLDCMRELHDVLEMYLTVSFDEDTYMLLNDNLVDTFEAMHSYFMEHDI